MHQLSRFVGFYSDHYNLLQLNDLSKYLNVGPFGAAEFIDRQQGLIPPPSFVPHWVSVLNYYTIQNVHTSECNFCCVNNTNLKKTFQIEKYSEINE